MDVTQFINLGLAGAALWMLYKLYDKNLDRQESLAVAIAENTAAVNELYQYVKVRNGTLERLVQQDPKVKRAAKGAVEEQPSNSEGSRSWT